VIGALILGIVAGFLGRLLMPGKDKMGFVATIVLGIAGAALGFLVFTKLLGIGDNKAFDLGGLPGAVLGVIALLAVYRIALRDKRDKRAERRRNRMKPAL
jgi:uncharacterized membrane protein YeaQ/YmgE (transglycosylase-associated protein family)